MVRARPAVAGGCRGILKNYGLGVDVSTGMVLNSHMIKNAATSPAARGNENTISTVVTKDGAEHIIRHRNTMMGWVNAVRRAGIDTHDVDHDRSHAGMPESSRVAR